MLKTDQQLSVLAYGELNEHLQEDIWRCNLSESDINNIWGTAEPFWRDVLRSWALINFSERTFPEDFIWYNSNIRIGNQPIFWQVPYEKGLKTIQQLFDKNSPISYIRAHQIFGLSVLEYNAIISAIPRVCKNMIYNEALKMQKRDMYDEVLSAPKICKYVTQNIKS